MSINFMCLRNAWGMAEQGLDALQRHQYSQKNSCFTQAAIALAGDAGRWIPPEWKRLGDAACHMTISGVRVSTLRLCGEGNEFLIDVSRFFSEQIRRANVVSNGGTNGNLWMCR